MHFERLTVIGVGLIGGSFALAAKERGLVGRVVGVARSQETRDAALARGVVDEAAGDPVEAVQGADLVYVATPVRSVGDILQAIAPALPARAVVTDAGSTKASTVALARQYLAGRCAFVGGHPMAGSHESGPLAARADLFAGKSYFLTPSADTSAQALARLQALVEALGALVVLVDPEEHDRLVALTSHLPHLLASALCATLADRPESPEFLRAFTGPGLRDVTRVAKAPADVWRDVLADNEPHVREALAALREQIDRYLEAMHGDPEALVALWSRAARWRKELEQP